MLQHDHHHHHHEITLGNISRALVIGIVLNALFVVVEAVAGFIAHSLALLTDAGHNLTDVISLGMALLAFRLARIKPNEHYTYGYRKSTVLSAFLNAMILLVAVGSIGFEAVQRLFNPQPLNGYTVALVAGAGIIINGFTALLFMKDRSKDLNIKGAYLHMAADALVSAGVVIAGILIHFTKWYWLDSTISFVIMIVILFTTWNLLSESVRLSLDGVPKNIDLNEVTESLQKVKGVKSVHHVHVWAMSTTESALTAHIVIDPAVSFSATPHILHELKHQMEHLQIQHSTFEMEVNGETCNEKMC